MDFQRKPIFLNQYIFEKNPGLICLQKTVTFEKSSIINMATYQDTNKQQNKGCAMLVKSGLSFTKLVERSEKIKKHRHCMGVLEWDRARFLVSNMYLKLGYEKGVTEFLKMLKCAGNMAKFHWCKGIITMGKISQS